MLEPPDLPDEAISACLQAEYALPVERLEFLPLGADQNTAVYRADAADQSVYFVKLRSGVFDQTAVALPKFLRDQGLASIIAPLPTREGQLWSNLGAFALILYPFVQGRDGYEAPLSDDHWRALGAALRNIHSLQIPPALAAGIQHETFTPRWRLMLKTFVQRMEDEVYSDLVAKEVAAFLSARRREIHDLIGRAERLALSLHNQTPPFALCHADIHAGNVLVTTDQAVYIVDWDAPIFAPKERDLMYAGGGLMGGWRAPSEEEALFYQGYGPTHIDPIALAYYRYERIIQDLAVFCEQLLLSDAGGEDRAQSLRYLKSNFLPGNTIEIAYQSDKSQVAP